MMDTLVILVVSVAVGFNLALLQRWVQTRSRSRKRDEAFSDPGISVEADCRACGQFNRVPSHRLRDHPKCGSCKARLMPGKHVVLCRVTPIMNSLLRAKLNALWTDEDRLWQSLADHVALEAKARAEACDPSTRVVN